MRGRGGGGRGEKRGGGKGGGLHGGSFRAVFLAPRKPQARPRLPTWRFVPPSRPVWAQNPPIGGGEGGPVRTTPRVGVWVEKPGYDERKYSHDVSRERALQREDVTETKPSIEILAEYSARTARLEDSNGTTVRAEGPKESSVCVSRPTQFCPQTGVMRELREGDTSELRTGDLPHGWAREVSSSSVCLLVPHAPVSHSLVRLWYRNV